MGAAQGGSPRWPGEERPRRGKRWWEAVVPPPALAHGAPTQRPCQTHQCVPLLAGTSRGPSWVAVPNTDLNPLLFELSRSGGDRGSMQISKKCPPTVGILVGLRTGEGGQEPRMTACGPRFSDYPSLGPHFSVKELIQIQFFGGWLCPGEGGQRLPEPFVAAALWDLFGGQWPFAFLAVRFGMQVSSRKAAAL